MATTNKAISKEYLLTQLKNFESVILSKKYGTVTDLTTVSNAIAVLNSDATTTGSVAYTAAEAVAKIVANAPADFDTLKEISDWIAAHPEDTTAMNTAIKNLQTLVGTIPEGATATTVTAYAKELVDATQGEVDTLEGLVGTLPDGTKATTVVGYVDEKCAEVVASGITFEDSNIDFSTEYNA